MGVVFKPHTPLALDFHPGQAGRQDPTEGGVFGSKRCRLWSAKTDARRRPVAASKRASLSPTRPDRRVPQKLPPLDADAAADGEREATVAAAAAAAEVRRARARIAPHYPRRRRIAPARRLGGVVQLAQASACA
jgi:hypothetical protein